MSQYRLSEQQIAQFAADGFYGPIPAYLPPEKIDRIRALYFDIENTKRVNPIYDRFSLRDWHLCEPALAELLEHPGMHVPVSQMLGNSSLILWRSFWFDKPPGAGELGWHQEWGQFRGDELGGKTASLRPHERFNTGANAGQPWDLTVWIALEDVTPEMGPVRFVRGTHRRHFPVKMVPLMESAFNNQLGNIRSIDSVPELVHRCKEMTLLTEPVPTSGFFDGVDVERISLADAHALVFEKLSKLEGEVTDGFEPDPTQIVDVPLRKGEFLVFYERTMHGSGANQTGRHRLGVNCRVTHADTVVYPDRLRGNVIDGVNLNVTRHRCVHLCGDYRHPENVFG